MKGVISANANAGLGRALVGVEVGFPIYDAEVRTEIRQLIAFQLADNTKACLIDQQGNNQPIRNPEAPPVRAQYASYDWLKQRASPESEAGISESTAPS